MRVIINHPTSRLRKYHEDDGLLWDRIEDFLIANKIKFTALTEDEEIGLYDGVMVLLPDLSPRVHHYPQKDEHIKLVSDLGKFLFEDFKLEKSCLHFLFTEECINGEGKLEKCWDAIDDVTYEELTGQPLEEHFKPMRITRQEIKEEYGKRKNEQNMQYWSYTEDYEPTLERLLITVIGDPNFKTKKVSTQQIMERLHEYWPHITFVEEKVEYALKKLAKNRLIKET